MPYVFLLLVAMPIIEIAVIVQVGNQIGALATIGIVILTAVLGTVMLRQQGLATLRRFQERTSRGELPAQQLLEGLLLVIGGVLLLTPGFVTDAIGFLCLVPVSRVALARMLSRRSVAFVAGNGRVTAHTAEHSESPASTSGVVTRHSNTVIEGDYQQVKSDDQSN